METEVNAFQQGTFTIPDTMRSGSVTVIAETIVVCVCVCVRSGTGGLTEVHTARVRRSRIPQSHAETLRRIDLVH